MKGIKNIINIPFDSMKVVSFTYCRMSTGVTEPLMLIHLLG